MIGLSLYFFQERLLFLPVELSQDYQYTFNQPFEELFLQPEEGVLINAIHFKAKNSKGVILYFHGNAGNLARWGKITSYFVDLHYDVFVIDYRTYGKSKGKLSESALYRDAQFCFDHLKKSYKETDIVLYGRSLGTGIASHVAMNNNPKKMILETPYYSIEDVAKKRFPVFPVSWLLKYNIPTHKFLDNTNCDVFIIHGTEDKVVPYSSAQKLAQMQLPNIYFTSIENGRHNNLMNFELYHHSIENWLK